MSIVLLVYVMYLLQVSGGIYLAISCWALGKHRPSERLFWWGGAVYFGLGAISALGVARQVFREPVLTVSLREGLVLYSTFPRVLALAAMCWGFYRWLVRGGKH